MIDGRPRSGVAENSQFDTVPNCFANNLWAWLFAIGPSECQTILGFLASNWPRPLRRVIHVTFDKQSNVCQLARNSPLQHNQQCIPSRQQSSVTFACISPAKFYAWDSLAMYQATKLTTKVNNTINTIPTWESRQGCLHDSISLSVSIAHGFIFLA